MSIVGKRGRRLVRCEDCAGEVWVMRGPYETKHWYCPWCDMDITCNNDEDARLWKAVWAYCKARNTDRVSQ